MKYFFTVLTVICVFTKVSADWVSYPKSMSFSLEKQKDGLYSLRLNAYKAKTPKNPAGSILFSRDLKCDFSEDNKRIVSCNNEVGYFMASEIVKKYLGGQSSSYQLQGSVSYVQASSFDPELIKGLGIEMDIDGFYNLDGLQ